MSGARLPLQPGRPCEQAALFARAVLFTIPEPDAEPDRRASIPLTSIPLTGSTTVFSLLGVLGITIVLLIVVVMTAGLILGK
jgi:hypothetical protein